MVRRKAMTKEEIDALHLTIACTPKANRPFVLYKSSAPAEEVL